MTTTDSNGILFYEQTDEVTPLASTFNGLAQSVSDAFTADRERMDDLERTASTSVATTMGTGTMLLTRIGDWVEMSFNIASANFATSTNAVIGTVPDGYRPPSTLPGSLYMSAYPGVFIVNNGGTVTGYNQSGTTVNAVRGQIVYHTENAFPA